MNIILLCLFLFFGKYIALDPITWKGYQWNIKERTQEVGPGPNLFSSKCVNVNTTSNELTLSIIKNPKNHICGEVFIEEALGYGTYQIDVDVPIENITDYDENIVFGFFLYKDDENEIDIEFSKWGDTEKEVKNMDYVSQPDIKGSSVYWRMPTKITKSRHSFKFTKDRIVWRAIDRCSGEIVYTFNTTINIPSIDALFPRLNYWMMNGITPKESQNITITDFKFSNESIIDPDLKNLRCSSSSSTIIRISHLFLMLILLYI